MIKTEFTFDDKTYRHSLNGHESVLHCHHYMGLTTKLAEDFDSVGGTQILKETAEDTIRPMLDTYFQENGVNDTAERLSLGAEYYAVMGMGLMTVSGDEQSGKAVLTHSHVDEGWVKKWGKADRFINHFTCGFVAAIFAAAFDAPSRSYQTEEKTSIAVGNNETVIAVNRA
jgi:hypothetical protein